MFIRLNGIQLFAHHGVYEDEIRTGNHFEIDLEVEIPDDLIPGSDALVDALDYTMLFKAVSGVSESRRYNLLETLARDICKRVLQESPIIDTVRIKLRKINPPTGGSVNNVEVELLLKK